MGADDKTRLCIYGTGVHDGNETVYDGDSTVYDGDMTVYDSSETGYDGDETVYYGSETEYDGDRTVYDRSETVYMRGYWQSRCSQFGLASIARHGPGCSGANTVPFTEPSWPGMLPP